MIQLGEVTENPSTRTSLCTGENKTMIPGPLKGFKSYIYQIIKKGLLNSFEEKTNLQID